MADSVYSYHTFLYPFRWERINATKKFSMEKDLKDFKKELIKNGWENWNMITPENTLSEQTILDYQVFQYFNSAARKAMFKCNGNIVNSLKFNPLDIHNKAQYVIKAKGREFILNINNILVSLYNTGVGILRLETENFDYTSEKDVKLINEYGRRLYPEFLHKNLGDYEENNITASEICIRYDSHGLSYEIKDNMKEKAEAHLTSNKEKSYVLKPDHPIGWMKKLLFGKPSDNIFKLIPAIDDRMFVCCCICDSKVAEKYTGYDPWDEGSEKDNEDIKKEKKQKLINNKQNSSWKYLNDWDTGNDLYALINVDADSSSCQNRKMLDKYLEEQLYTRWIEYGTIHAVTNHSMFCITSPSVVDKVINPFLIEYVPLCQLVLAQRASLISYDSRITDTITDKNHREELDEIQEEFTRFQGQLMLSEVTSQIQGIEIYKKTQEMLFISKLHSDIQEQLHNLFEVSEAKQAKKQEGIEKGFTILAILAVGSAWADIYGYFVIPWNDSEFHATTWWLVGIIVLAFAYVTLSGWLAKILEKNRIKKFVKYVILVVIIALLIFMVIRRNEAFSKFDEIVGKFIQRL